MSRITVEEIKIKKSKVAVLGGGIAGVMSAKILDEKGYDVVVYESESQIGGLCRTEKLPNGFLFDTGGGHIFHSVYKDVLDRIIGLIGRENLLQHKRNTRIYIYDKFVKYPFENGLSDLPPEARYECLMGYIEAWRKRNEFFGEYDNFMQMIVGMFGRGIADHFMIPYNRKIWCVDPAEMGLDWIKNRVPSAPIEDVVKSALGMETEGYKHQSVFYYPEKGGIQSFVDIVAQPIVDKIRLNSPVKKISRTGTGWRVNGENYDRIVSSIALDEFVNMYDGAPDEVKNRSRQLRHIGLLSVLVCLKTEKLPDYSWLYLPHDDQGEINRLTYFTNYSKKIAPEGMSSLLCETTFLGENDFSENRVMNMVDNLVKIRLIDRNDVESVHWRFNEYAYILPDLNMSKNRDYIIGRLESCSLNFIGRFGSFRYYNMDQVIKQVLDMVETKF